MARRRVSTNMREKPWIRPALLVAAFVGVAFGLFALDPIPQDPRYHAMADQRALLGIPNALDVISNLPFAIVGLVGLVATFGKAESGRRRGVPFDDPWLRWPYAAVFGGALLVAFGSAYYHLAPDDFRLVWDRLPMTLSFVGLAVAVLGERVSGVLARRSFGPLLLAGPGTVLYWYWTELRGAGDLRPYLFVQLGSLVIVAVILALYPRRGGGTGYFVAGLAAYLAAKGFELADRAILDASGVVSGHTLKHVAAAAGLGCIAAMLHDRGAAPVENVVRQASPRTS